MYATKTYPVIVINVKYLNKGSCHYVKLPDRAESGPLKSLYAFKVTNSFLYYVGLMYNYTV